VSTFPTRGVVFGLVPQCDDTATRQRLNDVCTRLGERTGLAVIPHRAPSPDALANAWRAGRIQVAWIGAAQLVLSDALQSAIPILCSVREGAAWYHAVLFTVPTSGIKTLDDVRHKRVAWVAASSASGCIVPRLSLARRGVALGAAFAEEMFVGSHSAVARAVFDGRADVGGTYAIFENADARGKLVRSGFLESDPARRVVTLDVAGPIPGDLIIVAASVPNDVRRSITRALHLMGQVPADRQIVRSLIGADSFTDITSAAREELHALVDEGRRRGLLG